MLNRRPIGVFTKGCERDNLTALDEHAFFLYLAAYLIRDDGREMILEWMSRQGH